MRNFTDVAVFALAVFICGVFGGTVSAETVTVNGGQVKVQARVLPMHTIIIDELGNITKIASNTTDDIATPRVYLLNVAAENERPLTQSISEQHQEFVPTGKSRVGILYDRYSVMNLFQSNKLYSMPDQRPVILTLK